MRTELAWEVVAAIGAQLGERPVWDPNTNCRIWVDINAGDLHQFAPEASTMAASWRQRASPGPGCRSVPPRRARAAATCSRPPTGSG